MLFKERKKRLLAGIDLGNRDTQISFFYTDREEPVTVSTVNGQEQYNIPTVLCKRFEVNQWFYGKDAIRHAQEGDGCLVENLLTLAREESETVIGSDKFNPAELLGLFLRRVLALGTNYAGAQKVDGLMITVEDLDHHLIDILTGIIPLFGLEEGQVSFQSHTESFFQFMIHQEENLWRQQVLVCDYSNEFLKCFRMETNKKTTPIVTFIEERKFETMPYEKVPQEEPFHTRVATRLDGHFNDVIDEMCQGYVVSTCYLLGEGFLGDWCKESLKKLCRGRRVFQGNNLYSKGACYAMQEKMVPSDLSDRYVYLGNDKVKANIGMHAYDKGKEIYFPVMDAGINWYDARKEWDMMLNTGEDQSLSFFITPLNGRDKKELVMTLDKMPVRPNGTTRIRLSLEFIEESKFVIHVTDMGFGEFFPSSGLEWKEEATWEE